MGLKKEMSKYFLEWVLPLAEESLKGQFMPNQKCIYCDGIFDQTEMTNEEFESYTPSFNPDASQPYYEKNNKSFDYWLCETCFETKSAQEILEKIEEEKQ